MDNYLLFVCQIANMDNCGRTLTQCNSQRRKRCCGKKFYLEKSNEVALLSEEGRMNLEFKATGDNKVKEQAEVVWR